MSGHLFIIDGDIMQLSSDAWLLPSDADGWVTRRFASAIGLTDETRLDLGPWPPDGMILHVEGIDGGPDIWSGDVGRQGLAEFRRCCGRAVAFVERGSTRVRGR